MPDDRLQRTVTALEAVHPPRPMTPVVAAATLPCVTGRGSRSYSCPGCRRTLLERIECNQFPANTVFKCPHCGSYSRMPLGR
jgi:hypothetical protein